VIAKPGMVVLAAGIAAVLLVVALAVPAQRLAPLAWGMVAVLWFVWLSRDWSQYVTSAVAHTSGGLLVGWVLTGLDHRVGWMPPRPDLKAVLLGALAIGVAWELAEWSADQLLGTHMSGGALDTGLDVTWDVIGATLGFALWQRRTPRVRV
jgi:hypothetical protein